MQKDYNWIKKHYGEVLADICRDYFSELFLKEGLLPYILQSKFQEYRGLGNEIIFYEYELEFKDYIYSFVGEKKVKENIKTNKTPYELLEEAGYNLYECTTEEEVNSFKKYYDKNEQLCTFRKNRLEKFNIFFAVRKDINKYKRKDMPKRDDEYGTSVMSLQFSKGKINNVSIKSRYNHSVINPDSTYNCNLENIIPGLTNSFYNSFGYIVENYNLSVPFELPNYYLANDEKIYRYTQELNEVYYCVNNTVITNEEIIIYDKSRYLLMENYLLDLSNGLVKNLISCDVYESDITFPGIFKEGAVNSQNLNIGNLSYKLVTIKCSENLDNRVLLNHKNEIVEVYFPNTKILGDDFLYFNKTLKYGIFSNLEKIGKNFLYSNNDYIELVFNNNSSTNEIQRKKI